MSKFGAIRIRNADGSDHADPSNGRLPVSASVEGMEFEGGSVRVVVQDQSSYLIDYYFRRDVNSLSFSSPQTQGSYSITVSSNPGISVGNIIRIQEEEVLFQAKILSVSGTTITLDTPIDAAFTPAAVVAESSIDMNVDGSVTPVVFSLEPNFNYKWDVVRVAFAMTHATPADDSKFGGIPSLSRGLVLRKADGVLHTIFNVKTNGEFKLRSCDSSYTDRASAVPGNEYGTNFKRTFGGQDRNGVVVRVDGGLGESVQVIVQDDLTALASFHAVAQGHVVV